MGKEGEKYLVGFSPSGVVRVCDGEYVIVHHIHLLEPGQEEGVKPEIAVPLRRWKAPEITRGIEEKENEKSCVFTIGMICHSLLVQDKPFGEDVDVVAVGRIGVGERPSVSLLEDMDCELLPLILECWHQADLNRPSLQEVRQRVEGIYEKKFKVKDDDVDDDKESYDGKGKADKDKNDKDKDDKDKDKDKDDKDKGDKENGDRDNDEKDINFDKHKDDDKPKHHPEDGQGEKEEQDEQDHLQEEKKEEVKVAEDGKKQPVFFFVDVDPSKIDPEILDFVEQLIEVEKKKEKDRGSH
jgi:hypothetical protein